MQGSLSVAKYRMKSLTDQLSREWEPDIYMNEASRCTTPEQGVAGRMAGRRDDIAL